MSHMVETMAYAGELPWHGLGTKVSNELSPVQMMEKAGCNWGVVEADSYVHFNDRILPTGQKTLIRETDGKVLTNVGKDWKPCQNETAFEFFDEYVRAGDMEMHTAGSLNDGKIVWALAKVKESFDVVSDDRVDSYMLFSNPHTYGKSINVQFSPIRVVCNNTLSMALSHGTKNGVAVGHRAEFNPDMVKEQMGIAHEKFAEYKEMGKFLAGKKVTADALIEYYNTVFPLTTRTGDTTNVKAYEDLSRNAKLCYDALEVQPGAEFAQGSWWSAFNSVTYVTDHMYGNNANNRLHSQWYGQNRNRKLVAANKAVELATAA